jgi:hypothetical protein
MLNPKKSVDSIKQIYNIIFSVLDSNFIRHYERLMGNRSIGIMPKGVGNSLMAKRDRGRGFEPPCDESRNFSVGAVLFSGSF